MHFLNIIQKERWRGKYWANSSGSIHAHAFAKVKSITIQLGEANDVIPFLQLCAALPRHSFSESSREEKGIAGV